MNKSFLDLENDPDVSVADLKATFRDYAESGAGITARVTISVIARTGLDVEDLVHLRESARIGYDKHLEWSKRKPSEINEAREYLKAAIFLAAWTADPPREPLASEDGTKILDGGFYIGVFADPRRSCTQPGESDGMMVYPSRDRSGGGLLFGTKPYRTGIGWGVEAFRALVKFDGNLPVAPAPSDEVPAPGL